MQQHGFLGATAIAQYQGGDGAINQVPVFRGVRIVPEIIAHKTEEPSSFVDWTSRPACNLVCQFPESVIT
jgi:hypothetical protein